MKMNGYSTKHWGIIMVEELTVGEKLEDEIITATIYCVNTNCAYVYELLHGDIVNEKKIMVKV
ncbi:MAG: hypothetical protein A4E28_01035 [Methanocella sp. PtaU1.Bin125]|nr:MAG: hypothetical protein A4E28_01035 [Methanocella sp. PtaU1.Bin125]